MKASKTVVLLNIEMPDVFKSAILLNKLLILRSYIINSKMKSADYYKRNYKQFD